VTSKRYLHIKIATQTRNETPLLTSPLSSIMQLLALLVGFSTGLKDLVYQVFCPEGQRRERLIPRNSALPTRP